MPSLKVCVSQYLNVSMYPHPYFSVGAYLVYVYSSRYMHMQFTHSKWYMYNICEYMYKPLFTSTNKKGVIPSYLSTLQDVSNQE